MSVARPGRRRVLVLTNMWPEADAPSYGIFVREQVEALRLARPEWRFDVEVIDGRRRRSAYAIAVPRLRRRLRDGFDLLHAHYGLTGAVGMLQRRVPMVLSLHGSDVLVPWQRRVSRMVAPRARAVIVASEQMRAALGSEAVVMSMGVDLDLFVPTDRREARARLGLPADRLLVLFPSHPTNPVKDYALFEATLAELPEETKERTDAVHLTRIARADVPLYLSAVDAMLLTSRHEGSPSVVREALACGLPVVSVDVGDVRSLLDGVRGCAVLGREPGALAAALQQVLARPGRSDGRQRILDRGLDQPSIARRVLALYDTVLAGSR